MGALEVAGLAALIGFALCTALLIDPASNVRAFQIGYAAGWVGYVILIRDLLRPGRGVARIRWRWWLAGCIVLRIALLHTTPSDDTYRYVWEGRIQRAGMNPFSHPPDAPHLARLRDADWKQINHPNYPTIYPPVAQAVFLLASLIHPSIYTVKAIFVLFDVGTLALLARWLAAAGHPPQRALVYGLCPLVVAAFAVDGHVDSLMLFFTAGAGLLMARGRYHWAAVALAGAIAAKIVAVVLLGWLAVRHWRAALLCVACLVVAYLPFASAGAGLFESLARFVGQTDFFGLVYPVTERLAGGAGARWVGVALLLGVAAWSLRRRADLAGYGRLVMGTLVLVAPVVHYWYVCWALPFLAWRVRYCWLVLAGSMVFYFEAEHARVTTGQWQMPAWAPYATYLPFIAAWGVERLVPARRSGEPDQRSPSS
ncbi:MAG: hypothetical protein GY778_25730 [bacterium]|nr:hypothetical protein [bacterium]